MDKVPPFKPAFWYLDYPTRLSQSQRLPVGLLAPIKAQPLSSSGSVRSRRRSRIRSFISRPQDTFRATRRAIKQGYWPLGTAEGGARGRGGKEERPYSECLGLALCCTGGVKRSVACVVIVA